jgi:hypothetical protein
MMPHIVAMEEAKAELAFTLVMMISGTRLAVTTCQILEHLIITY